MRSTLTLAALFLFLSTSILYGRNFYISGLKKDTLSISSKVNYRILVLDEEYVNDIPFNTKMIAIESLFTHLEKPQLESYINDIPFNTEVSSSYYLYTKNKILVEDEKYIDDIPFNTLDLATKYQSDCSSDFAFDLEKRKCDN